MNGDHGTPNILIVDDNSQNIQLAAQQLREEGLNIAFARSGDEALQAVLEESFDLFLLDVMMPDMDGFELCTRIQELPLYRDVPIIFLTARDDKESVTRGFALGGVDYIAKPFHGPELVSRVRTHIRLRHTVAALEQANAELQREVVEHVRTEQELRQSQEAMVEANRLLAEQARRDPLTGLQNRRQLRTMAEYEHDRLGRTGGEMAVVICDVDRFKLINDDLGHDCGDEVLQDVAQTIRACVRRDDQVGRWGGEEFLIVLPGTTLHGGETVAEKIRATIERREFHCGGEDRRITITCGVATCTADIELEQAVRAADQALLYGKRTGRNRVILDGQ